jgi:hypothetical protein
LIVHVGEPQRWGVLEFWGIRHRRQNRRRSCCMTFKWPCHDHGVGNEGHSLNTCTGNRAPILRSRVSFHLVTLHNSLVVNVQDGASCTVCKQMIDKCGSSRRLPIIWRVLHSITCRSKDIHNTCAGFGKGTMPPRDRMPPHHRAIRSLGYGYSLCSRSVLMFRYH